MHLIIKNATTERNFFNLSANFHRGLLRKLWMHIIDIGNVRQRLLLQMINGVLKDLYVEFKIEFPRTCKTSFLGSHYLIVGDVSQSFSVVINQAQKLKTVSIKRIFSTVFISSMRKPCSILVVWPKKVPNCKL